MRVQLLILLFAMPAVLAKFATIGLSRFDVDLPPRSRYLETTGNGSSIPTGGAVWPTGIFWCYVEIGTPPVSFPVAIDSGSGDLDVSGKNCEGCVTTAPNRGYDHKQSSTAKPAFPFVFSNSYQTCDLKNPVAGCTITGNLYADQVSLAGLGPVTIKVGSIQSQTSNFDQFKEIDGVMGFTMESKMNVFSELVRAGKCDNVWALCINNGAKGNGTLTVGGVDPRLSIGAPTYVDDVGNGFRAVQVNDMVLGNTSLKISGSAILDTGTNVLLVPSQAMPVLQSSMCNSGLKNCDELWANKCVELTQEEVAAYPPLAMRLDGIDLEMTSEDYLLQGSPLASSRTQYCLGIRDGGSAGGNGFIIGDTTMRHYYLVFDLERQKVGWGKVNKTNCGNV